ncbi:MAG TPA: mechanosensitive ion channel domain-containing protein [Gaiellaceae bacterium]|nr:mechanosensitive ion channel domain-containing protein [Gaiellaceae bacterium]
MVPVVTVIGLFAAAALLAKASGVVARGVLTWHDRRNDHPELGQTQIATIKRRETLVALVQDVIAIAGFVTAGVLAFAQLIGGVDRLTAIAGASFMLVLIGFALQRVLTDIIAGFAMFAERWYSVGDTIFIPGHELQGIVEDVSLRRTRLQTLDGEVIHIHNSQIPAVRVLPQGVKELAVELFVTDGARAESIIGSVVSALPQSSTTFVRRPWVEEIEEIGDSLVRIRMRASVVPGREWLVDGFFADLLRARSGEALIAHGPVALVVDEAVQSSFSRASAISRRARPGSRAA